MNILRKANAGHWKPFRDLLISNSFNQSDMPLVACGAPVSSSTIVRGSTAMFSTAFISGFLCIALGHLFVSSSLQYVFYRRRASSVDRWKVQPRKCRSLEEGVARRWWLPLLSLLRIGREKNGRHRLHGLFATFNVLMASVFAGLVSHFVAAGKTKAYWECEGSYAWRFVAGFALSLAWQSVLEYYWHRLMHLPPVYVRLHKYHHFYKSPEPFDDMFIHPLEAFGYFLQLYSPPFIFPMPVASYAMYMVVCGLCGVLDHSGVAFSVPGLYDTTDHDLHHSRFEVNYAFPFPFLDVLNGTYEGAFLGKLYSCGRSKGRHQ